LEVLDRKVTLRRRRVFLFALKAAITALLLYAVLERVPIQDVLGGIGGITGWWIGGCVLALVLQTGLVAARWMIVLRHLGGQARFVSLWHHVVIGSFFNQFLPSGMGGDIFRIWYLQRSGTSLGKAAASVITDRVMGLLGIFAMVAVGIPYLLVVAEDGVVRNLLLIFAIALALCIAAFLRLDLISRKVRNAPGLQRVIHGHPSLLRLFDGVERTSPTVRKMLLTWPDGSITLILSIANQLIVGAVVFALANIAGAAISLTAAMLMFPFVLLVSMVPVSLAGWGMREGAMVVVFALIGTPGSGALIVSLLFGASLLLASLPGGLLWLASHRPWTEKDVSLLGPELRDGHESRV
jgi:uncharacterized protein (TIRG00374 family)